MGRWQRFLSRFLPQETDLVATVDATEEGDALTVTLAVPDLASSTSDNTLEVLAIDAARGRVQTRDGQRKLSSAAQKIVAALPTSPKRAKGTVQVSETQIPETLRTLRAIAADTSTGDASADSTPITETSNARAIKLSERRALQYEFQVDFANEQADAIAVQPHIVSADGKVRMRAEDLVAPPASAPTFPRQRARRGNQSPAPLPPERPRWVRAGKTYYMAPAEVAPDVQPYTQGRIDLHGDAVPFFLLRQLKQLGKSGKVIASDAVKSAKVESTPLEPVSILDMDDQGWLSVDVAYRSGDQSFTHEEIAALPPDAKYVQRGTTWVPIDRKADHKLDDALNKVERTLNARRDAEGRLRVAPGQGDEARRVLLDAAEIDESAAFQKFLADLAGFKKIEALKPPKGLLANLRPYQVEGFRWLAFLRRYYLNGVLADDMGLGKAMPLDAKILTPTGWKCMGDIEIGDPVINSQGGVSHVTGVFPQGVKDIYRVEFTDGSLAECCDEHLWHVNTALRRSRGYDGRVLPLSQIRETLKDPMGNNQHFIPMVQPIEFDEGELPLHPYLVGALLGDGCLYSNQTRFTSADQELLDYIRKALPEGIELVFAGDYDWRITSTNRQDFGRRNIVNFVTNALRTLELAGHTAHTKFIPDMYKFASVQSRLELLRGLMDTDGSICDNVLEFSSVSERLIRDVQFLVQSLGGVARLKQKKTTWTHNNEHKEGRAYRLTIAMPNDFNPFKLRRKAELWKPREKYQAVRAFKSVTLVGQKEAQCIAVDAPDHLYVTNDCIVTHNTITVLTLLLYAKEHPDAERPDPTLIVCPTSVVDNWIDEGQKFTPTLKIVRYGGVDRERMLQDPANMPDVLVTTYETLRRDMGYLQRQAWDYVILDEAQKIKNPITDTARACRQLLTRHRLAVTGTPIENRLDELWALFDFLMPGYLGSQARFRRDFEGPIMREKSNAVADELKRKIAPFVLRRMKEQVAKDLPPKIYVARECRLTREQSGLYERIAGEGRERIMEQARGGGMVSLNMSILAALTQLKQICCHPALLDDGAVTQEIHGRSGKFELFKEELATRLEAGDKVLVFSQYAEMCKLIDRYLHEAKIPSLYLDGQTRNRQELVRTFQADESIRVFVLSLRAAGFGITLTAASTVMHYDRWWNPAVENQATDRAYRIGQQRSVHVVQFRTQDTIEEKIDKLLRSKTELFGDVIESDLNGKSVTREELLELFSFSPLREGATEDGIPVITPVAVGVK